MAERGTKPRPPAVAETGPANLAAPAEQERLAPAACKAVSRIAEFWGLSAAEISALLGGISERSWYRMKAVAPSTMGQDMLTRASVLVGIFKGLRLLFSEPLADEWVKRPNRHALFGGSAPVDAMIAGGIPKMLQVRAHIDALRGGL